jgi:hypothetical protein
MALVLRQAGLELFEPVFGQVGVGAQAAETLDDQTLRRNVALALRDVLPDHCDLS